LLRYGALTGAGRYRDAAEAALAAIRGLVEKAPRFAGWSLAAAQAALDGPLEIVVVTEPDDEIGQRLAAKARASLGAVLVVVRPEQISDAGIPLLAGRGLVDGRAAAYVCRSMVCERPVTDPGELLR
jgi:hypothetical protein